jgi:PST family polysaccharide transporter
LPKFSELSSKSDIRNEILFGVKVILPVVFLSALVIFLFRDQLIFILFTEKFKPMESLFGWQLVGDFLKVPAWMLGYLMISKALVKRFVFTEIIFTLSFVLLAKTMIKSNGLDGMAMAYAINYGMYLLALCFLMKDYLFTKADTSGKE